MIFKACAIALIASFVVFILRELGMKGVGVIGAMCAAVLISLGADVISDAADSVNKIAALADVGEVSADVLKIVGVGYVFGFCADVCSDLGERSVSEALTLIGRLEVLGIALPYLGRIVEFGLSLI